MITLLPFLWKVLKPKQKGFVQVKFEGVESENDAKVILRKDLFLPISILPELEGLNFYDHEVVGWKVVDLSYGDVGVLENIIDNNVNPLIQIMKDEHEVLVPLIDGLVKKVDRDAKELHILAPEGLIEMYLES